MFTLKNRFAPTFMYIIQRYANVLSVRNCKLKKSTFHSNLFESIH